MSHNPLPRNTGPTDLRDQVRGGPILPVDPAAVAHLKRVLAEQAREKQKANHVARILTKAQKQHQASAAPALPAKEKPMRKNYKKLITAEMAGRWAARIRAGESRYQIVKTNEVGASEPIVKKYLEEFGFDSLTGAPLTAAARSRANTPAPAPKPPTPEPPAPEPAKETEQQLAIQPVANGAAPAALSPDAGDDDTLDRLAMLLRTFRGGQVQASGKVKLSFELEIEL